MFTHSEASEYVSRARVFGQTNEITPTILSQLVIYIYSLPE